MMDHLPFVNDAEKRTLATRRAVPTMRKARAARAYYTRVHGS